MTSLRRTSTPTESHAQEVSTKWECNLYKVTVRGFREAVLRSLTVIFRDEGSNNNVTHSCTGLDSDGVRTAHPFWILHYLFDQGSLRGSDCKQYTDNTIINLGSIWLTASSAYRAPETNIQRRQTPPKTGTLKDIWTWHIHGYVRELG